MTWQAALEGIPPHLARDPDYLRERLGRLIAEFDRERSLAERAEDAVDVLLRLNREKQGAQS